MAIKVVSAQDWDINKIISGIEQSDVKAVIYFFSPSFEKYEPQKALADAFPEAACFGASMYGGWSSSGAVETGITAMSLSSEEVEDVFVSFHEGVKKDPIAAAAAVIAELKQKTAGEKINPDEYLGLIFFDGLCLGELIMKEFSIEQSLNMAFIGGAAADEMTFTKTLVGAGGKLSGDGLIAVILKMKIPFFFNHYVHYIPTEKTFTITRVEIMQRIAWEINGEPAAEFYARLVGVNDVSKLTDDIFAKNPFGLVLGDSIYVRSPNGVVNGTGLQFYCYIEAGSKVHLLKQGDILTHSEESLASAEHFLPGIQGCLLFNCVQRYLELKELNKVDAFNNVFSKHPMIGFNTYGEELFAHHNQTLTAVFFGNPPEEGTADPYKTKRLFHYTDSKLKSLAFNIVSRSEFLTITISSLKDFMGAQSSGGKAVFAGRQTIKENMDAMIEQSDISRDEIEKMLVVYQNNVEKTGEYVFNIVDEIREQNHRLIELKEKAESASYAKSNFLASISHEIRTPMNAITGMAELLLRGNISEESRGYAHDIKQAGNNLISLINDILDFSKIEAGKLEIVPVRYMIASLINDTINIIRIRLNEKPIRFYTNIEGTIPNNLFGDEVRLRQILLNLLSNAAKYTERGHISLSVTIEKRDENQIWLKYTVNDTGKGIKAEDQQKLFSEFVQVDTKRNRGVEGTGLGLAITKRLCALLGGDISMKSEYGKGSSFTVIIPQGIDTPEPFAVVDEPEKKKVLVYEGRIVYAQSVCWSLKDMGVPHTMVTNLDDFIAALFREEWTIVFSGYGLHNRIKQVMERPDADFPGGKKPPLALMVEWGTEAYIPNVRFVSLPIQSLSIANVLNGKMDSRSYLSNVGLSGVIRYIFPTARLLIVDDIPTNLKVAEGLLTPYKADIDTCLGGHEAIELVKRNEYDIVFMDHMMPEMDGIETTEHIRDWEREMMMSGESETGGFRGKVTIIALTANAVSGMREMFIEKGFDDFLAKPIDISKLDDALNRWIPKAKRERGAKAVFATEAGASSVLFIEGLDTAKGIAMTGGTETGYRSVLSMFRKDVEERLALLQSEPAENNLLEFTIQVHAIKSASASVGALEISAQAAKLEEAGRAADMAYIRENLNTFTVCLKKLVKDIGAVLGYQSGGKKAQEDIREYIPLLRELEESLKAQNVFNIDNLLDGLHQKHFDERTAKALEKLSDEVLMTEFNHAIKIVEDLIIENS
jgi:signal transduction histidine kinase/CheY-like chemotaxis protein/HPt (histidine-containing phosphotransfer) domain-containing protein